MNKVWKTIIEIIFMSILVAFAVILIEIDSSNYLKERLLIFWLFLLISIILFIYIIFDIIFGTSKKIKKRYNNINITSNYLDNISSESFFVLERYRKETILYLGTMTIVFFGLVVFYLVIYSNPFIRIISFIVFICLFSICGIKYENKKNLYTNYYKDTIVKELIQLINCNLDYNPNGDERNFNKFLKAGFIEPNYYKHLITDTITNNNPSDFFAINKIKLFCKHWRGGDELIDKFIFAYKIVNNNIPIEISIRRNSRQNDKVIDNTNFDKYFITEYNSNYNRVIIDDILNIVIDYYNKYYIDFNLKIKNNIIYIKFYIDDIFETPFIFKKAIDYKTVNGNYIIINGIINFCNGLKNVIEDKDKSYLEIEISDEI